MYSALSSQKMMSDVMLGFQVAVNLQAQVLGN